MYASTHYPNLLILQFSLTTATPLTCSTLSMSYLLITLFSSLQLTWWSAQEFSSVFFIFPIVEIKWLMLSHGSTVTLLMCCTLDCPSGTSYPLNLFPIDPTPKTLSFYMVYMYHHIEPKSVDSYLSGICNQLEPVFPNVHSDCHHSLVTRTLKGCKKLCPTSVSHKCPLTRLELELCATSSLIPTVMTTGYFLLSFSLVFMNFCS